MAIQIEFIGSLDFFKELAPAELHDISGFFFESKADRGDIIVLEGDTLDTLYFVTTGAVKIFKTSSEGKEQMLAIMRPGDSFNNAAVLDGQPSTVSVQAMGQVNLIGIKKDDLYYIIRNYEHAARNVIIVLSRRIRMLINLVTDLSFRNVPSRIAKILLETTNPTGDPTQQLTQRDMAAMAGTAREMVSRALKSLEEGGLITLEQRRITIKNRKALAQMVEA